MPALLENQTVSVPSDEARTAERLEGLLMDQGILSPEPLEQDCADCSRMDRVGES